MKKSKFTEERIALALKQSESGTAAEAVCRKMGISQAMFYNWRKKYGGLGSLNCAAIGTFDSSARSRWAYRHRHSWRLGGRI